MTEISSNTQHANQAEPPGRARKRTAVARSLWYVKPGQLELRTERLAPPLPGEVRVETHFSAISRGTERLIAAGLVPESEWQRMRAPFQDGTFPFPVKYGYSAVGIVTDGDNTLIGQPVFCLYPHQSVFQVPTAAVVPCGAVPMRRATLAANMETALNAHWDAETGPGARIAVIGAGIVGLLTAYLGTRIAGADVVITDIADDRAGLANALGIPFVAPDELGSDRTVVFHTTATSAGLATAMAAADFEGSIVELSWYGASPVSVTLGGSFHSRRLKLISSQVGHVAAKYRSHVSRRQRLEQAMKLLDDDVLDALVEEDIAFDELPKLGERIWSSGAFALPPIIRYTEQA